MSATVCTQVTKSQAPVLKPGLVSRLRDRWRVWQEHSALERMEERDLRGPGLSQWDVEREIARHLWDI